MKVLYFHDKFDLTGEPEAGMGWQIVNVHLVDGRIIPEIVAINSTYLMLPDELAIEVPDIYKLVVTNTVKK